MASDTRENPTLSYPGQNNFSLISLQNSTNRLQKDREPVWGSGTTRVGELSRLGR